MIKIFDKYVKYLLMFIIFILGDIKNFLFFRKKFKIICIFVKEYGIYVLS